MKLKLNKKKLKNLSTDKAMLPDGMTPQVAGGGGGGSAWCTDGKGECTPSVGCVIGDM